MEQTIFDKILAKELPADIVFEDDGILAFKDINPQAPVHVLVIPKIRAKDFSEFCQQPAVHVGEFMQGVAKVAAQIPETASGYRVLMNNGSGAGQTVFYLHAHILAGKQLSRLC